MKTNLYYFTGTGSSLSVANTLANKIEGATAYSIPKLQSGDINNENTDVIGIICPVYHLTLPSIVSTFIKQLTISKKTYLFIVTTSGGDPGNTFADAKDLFESKGLKLHSGFSIVLGDNSIVLSTPKEIYKNRLAQYDSHIGRIIHTIDQRGEHFDAPTSRRLSKTLYKYITKAYLRKYCKIHKKTSDMSKCTHCSVCVNLCPTNNIKINGHTPIWSQHCVECFACIHGCKQNAIRFGKLRRKDATFYRHPSIQLAEIIEANHPE